MQIACISLVVVIVLSRFVASRLVDRLVGNFVADVLGE
jgi:hypothetical protein